MERSETASVVPQALPPPYRRQVQVIVGLVWSSRSPNLYLPTLNADIINDGVAEGDTGVIVQVD